MFSVAAHLHLSKLGSPASFEAQTVDCKIQTVHELGSCSMHEYNIMVVVVFLTVVSTLHTSGGILYNVVVIHGLLCCRCESEDCIIMECMENGNGVYSNSEWTYRSSELSGSGPSGSRPNGSGLSGSGPSGSRPSGSRPSGSWPSGSGPSANQPSGTSFLWTVAGNTGMAQTGLTKA